VERPRVLVTRPEPGAARTAKMLGQLGFEPVVLPLTQTRALPGAKLAEAVDLVAITSANALRHAPAALIAELRDLPVFAVGARTAEVARSAGFGKVEDVGGTAALLAAALIERTPAGVGIAYLCGTPRKPILEAQLRQSGRIVHAIETYAAVRLAPDRVELEVLAEHGFDAALVYSTESAGALLELLAQLDRHVWENAAFVCLSLDIAQALPRHLRVLVAQTPDETSLLTCLEALFLRPSGSN
jgi:uroporphyrinogen-III synthase